MLISKYVVAMFEKVHVIFRNDSYSISKVQIWESNSLFAKQSGTLEGADLSFPQCSCGTLDMAMLASHGNCCGPQPCCAAGGAFAQQRECHKGTDDEKKRSSIERQRDRERERETDRKIDKRIDRENIEDSDGTEETSRKEIEQTPKKLVCK